MTVNALKRLGEYAFLPNKFLARAHHPTTLGRLPFWTLSTSRHLVETASNQLNLNPYRGWFDAARDLHKYSVPYPPGRPMYSAHVLYSCCRQQQSSPSSPSSIYVRISSHACIVVKQLHL